MRICGASNREDAKDLAQDAVISVVAKLQAGEEIPNLHAYLSQALANRFVDQLRRRGHMERFMAQEELPPSSEPSHETFISDWDEVQSVFSKIPRYRPRMKDGPLVLRALLLIHLDGLSQGEAARELGISRENLTKKLSDYVEVAIDIRDQLERVV